MIAKAKDAGWVWEGQTLQQVITLSLETVMARNKRF